MEQLHCSAYANARLERLTSLATKRDQAGSRTEPFGSQWLQRAVERPELGVAPVEPELDALALEWLENSLAFGAVNGRPEAQAEAIDSVHRGRVELREIEHVAGQVVELPLGVGL